VDSAEPAPDSPRPRKRSFAVRGEFLRNLRVKRGMTQVEAARQLDLTDRIIRKAEAGGPLEANTIARLALFYSQPTNRISPEQLFANPEEFSQTPKPGLSLEARVQRWFDGCWNNLNLDVIEELSVPDMVFRSESGTIRGHQEMRAWVLNFRQSFGDFDHVLEEVSDLGSAMVCRWSVAMTQIGPWLDLPPTGRRIVIRGVSWVQLVGDKFGDAWDFWDPGLIYQQLAASED
jgi:transcriptional regulator with XRE-family HTH domain